MESLAIAPLLALLATAPSPLLEQIDDSLAKAGRYLVSKQSPDGAWRSETYGFFRGGLELTGYVMSSLYFLPQAGAQAAPAYRKGVDYLVAAIENNGQSKAQPLSLSFPVYTSAMASRVVVLQEKSARNLAAQKAWLEVLLSRQLNEKNGWRRADPEFGGWGFSLRAPRKPAPNRLRDSFVESNLTSTIFGIAALRSAKAPADHSALRDALIFTQRCQNYSEDPAKADPVFDDGGFFFMPGDPLQNKAGIAGTDRNDRQRFHSYGTMTADGLRALVRSGLPANHPRVTAARKWLERNFTVTTNPGVFEPDREFLRNATYYYWVWAVAHAFQSVNVWEFETPQGKRPWAEELALELLRRQESNGSWINRTSTDAKEDDPLVSTPWAAAALAICRTVLAGDAARGERGPTLLNPG